MSLLPIFLKLEGRRCLLVGAGNVALEKIGSLLATGARLHVVAPDAQTYIQQLAHEGTLQWTRRNFEASDLDGNYLVITATDSPEVNAQVYRESVSRNILCNSVDDNPNCDFFFGAVVRRGDLQIAISTAGQSPAVAQNLRREIDEALPHELGPWLENLGQLRREVLSIHPRSEVRKSLLHKLAELPLCDSPQCPSRQLAHAPLTSNGSSVSLVGAGPGDPDLLTVKALRLIQSADVILHDDLVPDSILKLAAQSCELVNVGKRCGQKNISQDEINALMVEHAQARRSVVRLKSGDPLLFGRAAEEIAALKAAAIQFQIVPGISAGFAAAAAIGCSLSSRFSASNVIFSSGHHAQSHNQSSLPQREDATRVVYMPGRDLKLLAAEWLRQGLPPDLPCVIVSRAAQPDQEIRCCQLSALGDAEATQAPSLLIAGWAVSDKVAAAQLANLHLPTTA